MEGDLKRNETGILAHGFLRVRWGDCGHDKLVAFSCKRRGFCRRAAPGGQVASMLPPGLSGQMMRETFNNLVTSQSLMPATNSLMMVIAALLIIASVSIVLAPRAGRMVDAAAVGH